MASLWDKFRGRDKVAPDLALQSVAATEPSSAPPTRELGATGTIISDGFLLSDDINAKWANVTERNRIIQEMWDTDGKIQACLSAIMMPIIASKWVVRAPEDPTPLEQEQADFVEENMHGMSYPWDEVIEQILTYLPYGFSVFEKVYRYDPVDGRFHWRKWAPRHQSTIQKWNVGPDSGLQSVEQFTWKGESYETITLGADRLMVFTNQKHAGNWAGRSILRAAYRHFIYKDRLYRIDGIAHERHGVGIPKIKTPSGISAAEMAIVEKIGEGLRTHEKSYFVQPPGYDTEFMGMSTQLRDPINSIKHHNEEIAGSVLAGFLSLGFSATGSRALGATSSEFFITSLTKHQNYICAIMNKHAVPQLIYSNWGPQKRYPKIAAVPVQGIDFLKLAQAIFQFRQGGMVANDTRSIQHFHEVLGLPRPDPDWLEEHAGQTERGTQKEDPEPNGNGNGNGDGKDESEDHSAVRSAVELQILALTRIPKNGPMRFQPPLEGTLIRAMKLTTDDPDDTKIEKAAQEFSRRLALAAERGFLGGGTRESILRAREEAENSWPILEGAMQTEDEHAV